MTRAVALLSAFLLLLAACGDDDADVDAASSSTTSGSATDEDTSSTTAARGELPGERIEIFPYEGATLAVVGVAADDVLNVRTGPGPDFDVAYTLAPTVQDSTATGVNRQLDGGQIWAEIVHDGRTGWANTSFLLQPGQVTDETAALYPTPADRPSAETLMQLAQLVADRVDAEEPASEVVVIDGPNVGDSDELSEVTVDVIGLADDALGGLRLHLFAEEDAGGESFTLRTVEQQLLCLRGVTAEGSCA